MYKQLQGQRRSKILLKSYVVQAVLLIGFLSEGSSAAGTCAKAILNNKKLTVSEIESSPKHYAKLLQKAGFQNSLQVPSQLVSKRPDIVKQILNNKWRGIDEEQVDWNGRVFPMNPTTRSKAKRPLILYRGVPETPYKLDLIYLDHDHFIPLGLSHQTGTFMTRDKKYAIEDYSDDLIVIKYIFPPELVYGGRLRNEFLVSNSESFRRKAKKSEISKLLTRKDYLRPKKAMKLWSLSHVVDHTPFISYIEFLPTGKKYSVDEFMKEFHYWSPPNEREESYIKEFKDVESQLERTWESNRMLEDSIRDYYSR